MVKIIFTLYIFKVLRVLLLLKRVGGLLPECDITPDVFISEKITHKLKQVTLFDIFSISKYEKEMDQSETYRIFLIFT